jgi:hypothetical protein
MIMGAAPAGLEAAGRARYQHFSRNLVMASAFLRFSWRGFRLPGAQAGRFRPRCDRAGGEDCKAKNETPGAPSAVNRLALEANPFQAFFAFHLLPLRRICRQTPASLSLDSKSYGVAIAGSN